MTIAGVAEGTTGSGKGEDDEEEEGEALAAIKAEEDQVDIDGVCLCGSLVVSYRLQVDQFSDAPAGMLLLNGGSGNGANCFLDRIDQSGPPFPQWRIGDFMGKMRDRASESVYDDSFYCQEGGYDMQQGDAAVEMPVASE